MAERPIGPAPWQKSSGRGDFTTPRQRGTTPRITSPSELENEITTEPVPSPAVQAEVEKVESQLEGPSFDVPREIKLRRRAPLVSPEEKARYSEEGIRQQKQYEAEESRIVEQVSDPLSPESMDPSRTTPEYADFESAAQITRNNAKNMVPMAYRQDFESKEDFVISNYPTLYAAVQNAGLSKDKVYDVVNLTLAVDAALMIGATSNPRRQRELIDSMPRAQAALTIDILNAMAAESRKYDGKIGTRKVRTVEVDPDENLNPVANFLKSWFWDPSINISGLPFIYPDTDWGPIQDGELYLGGKGAIDALTSASEMTMRGIGTVALANAAARESGQPGVLGFAQPTAQQLTNAWNSTEAGQFDPTMIKLIRQQYDPQLVDIMLDFKKFGMMGVEDVEGAIIEKYGDNEGTLRIIDNIIFNTDPNSEISKLANEIDVAETSNLGNLAGWSFASMFGWNAGNYEDIEKFAENSLITSGTKLANVTAVLAGDPALALARFGKGIRSAKYGLSKFTKGEWSALDNARLEKVFDNSAVRNHYDYIGKQFEEIRAVDNVADRAQKFQTLSSQMRKWYDYDGLQVMYNAGIKNADDAKSFMLDGNNIGLLLSGQAAKRGKEFTAPHMTKANAVWKAVTFKARGLNPANMGGTRGFLSAFYGEDVVRNLDDDMANALVRKIEEDPQNAGRVLSDFAYVDGGGVQRTLLGKIIKPDPESYAMRNRYGWRRKGIATGDLGWFADRIGRLMARIPDTSRGIIVRDGSDSNLIKEYLQSIGMSRYFANTVKFAWSTWDEPTRIRFVNAMNRTSMYSTGVDLVNPELADDVARTFATATRPGVQYAPDQIDILSIRVQAEQNVRRLDDMRREMNLAALTPEERAALVQQQIRQTIDGTEEVIEVFPKSKIQGLTGDERKLALRLEIQQGIEDAKLNGRIYNPSALNATDNYALYDSQLSGRIALFNPQAMNQMMARQSYLNVLLGGGSKMTSLTDFWVLATLAGPRFIMRSGIEDFGLYALTGGNLFGRDGWLMGRRASQAIRESTERVEPTVKPLIRGGNKGMQLSLATTARREFGTRLAKVIPAMRGMILDYLSPEELAQATAMASARGAEKSREGLANLFFTAFARARFFSLNRLRYAKGEPLVLEGAEKQAADFIADGVKRGYLNSNMERAAETSQHLADGSVPAYKYGGTRSEVVDGVVLSYSDVPITADRVKEVTQGYRTSWQTGVRNHTDVEDFWMDLNNILYMDGAKGYNAIARSPQLYKLRLKMERALNSGDERKINDSIDEYDQFVREYMNILELDPNIGRFVLAQELSLRQFAERKLDDALRMMTTADGRFNNRLYNSLKLPEGAVPAGKGRKPLPESERKFGLYYFDQEGNFRYNLTVENLHDPKIPMPQSIGTADRMSIVTADKIPFSSRAWSKMGRALARLTREPIYIANYVDMRKLVEPFRLRMVDDLVKNGKGADEAAEMADDWAAKTASDKAYDLTMAYVDNPATRSQLAWQVRNIARFYRALEDFNRRMMRVAENKPETFWKMALTWNVLDDSGFVWEDEFGEKYFMFPGTQVAFDVMNKFLSTLGVQTRIPTLPMTWGAKVSMIAPSTDPNALVPTLSAPFSALAVKGMIRLMPSLPMLDAIASGLKGVPVAGQVAEFAASAEGSQTMEAALFGEYSVNQSFTSSLANDTMGPNWKRFIDAFVATSGGFQSRQQATDAYIAGAQKRAIHALMASGIYDASKDYTEDELMELRYIADTTSLNEVWLRLFTTPLLFATPQSISLDVSDEAREIGIDSGNALWLKYLNRYDTYEDAFIAFTKDNPGKAIFTVSKYESNDYYEMLLETEEFINNNFEEFKQRPTGLSHFAPLEGTYGGLQSFHFMRANDIRFPSTVEDYFQRSVRSTAQAEIQWVEFQAEEMRKTAVNNDEIKLIDEGESRAKRAIKEAYPYSEYGLDISLDRKANNQRDAEEIAESAKYILDKGLDSDGRARKYLDVFNQYTVALREMERYAENDDEKDIIRGAWRKYITDKAMPLFRGDDRGLRYLKILSGGLNITVEGL